MPLAPRKRACSPVLRNQAQETTFALPFVPGGRFLGFDFAAEAQSTSRAFRAPNLFLSPEPMIVYSEYTAPSQTLNTARRQVRLHLTVDKLEVQTRL